MADSRLRGHPDTVHRCAHQRRRPAAQTPALERGNGQPCTSGTVRCSPPTPRSTPATAGYCQNRSPSGVLKGCVPPVQKIVDERIDALLAGPTPGDVVSTLALPVPSLVISEPLAFRMKMRISFRSRRSGAPGATRPKRRRLTGEVHSQADPHADGEPFQGSGFRPGGARQRRRTQRARGGPTRPRCADRRSRDDREHDQPEHRGVTRVPRPAAIALRHRGSEGDRDCGRGTHAVSQHHPDRSAPHRR